MSLNCAAGRAEQILAQRLHLLFLLLPPGSWCCLLHGSASQPRTRSIGVSKLETC